MGVSGFLISWASFRATSPHASTFCARMTGVRSSTTATAPAGEPGGPESGTTVIDRWRSRPCAGSRISPFCREPRPASCRPISAATASRPGPVSTSSSVRPALSGSTSSRWQAAPFRPVMVPSASATTSPVPTVSNTVCMRRPWSSSSRFFRVRPARVCSTSSSLRASRSDMRLKDAMRAVNSSSPDGKSTRTPRSPDAIRSAPSATSRSGVVMRRAR